MTLSELLLSFVPLVIALAVAVVVIGRTGAFEQRAHRRKIEELLERIATAVERRSK